MDDINKTISDILGDEQKLSMVRDMASRLFGQEEKKPEPEPQTPDLSGIKSISSLISAAGMLKNDDSSDSVRLLLALKPHLSAQRRERVDTAVNVLRVLKIAPLLFNSGLINL